ncbi:MAG: 50S ribosomal protein L15 [Planctomycetes bacterium]|nr:50S ribosomal protein L15 [Planctomycetota bacterium]
MDITQITTMAGAQKRRNRVGRGRGSGNGKTCGRGHKGYGQRSGSGSRGLQEGGQMPLFRRLPKRGFNNARFRTEYSVVNVADLEARCEAGSHVTPEFLVERGLLRNVRCPVKILGNGDLTKSLTVDASKFSKSAEEKIRAAGGEPRVI